MSESKCYWGCAGECDCPQPKPAGHDDIRAAAEKWATGMVEALEAHDDRPAWIRVEAMKPEHTRDCPPWQHECDLGLTATPRMEWEAPSATAIFDVTPRMEREAPEPWRDPITGLTWEQLDRVIFGSSAMPPRASESAGEVQGKEPASHQADTLQEPLPYKPCASCTSPIQDFMTGMLCAWCAQRAGTD